MERTKKTVDYQVYKSRTLALRRAIDAQLRLAQQTQSLAEKEYAEWGNMDPAIAKLLQDIDSASIEAMKKLVKHIDSKIEA